jgi:hypothetical protein
VSFWKISIPWKGFHLGLTICWNLTLGEEFKHSHVELIDFSKDNEAPIIKSKIRKFVTNPFTVDIPDLIMVLLTEFSYGFKSRGGVSHFFFFFDLVCCLDLICCLDLVLVLVSLNLELVLELVWLNLDLVLELVYLVLVKVVCSVLV